MLRRFRRKQGRLFYNIIGSFSDFEREMIVERVNAGLANAKAKGVRLGRPEKDPSAAKRISQLRQQGLSMRQIAEKENLSAAGVLKILRRHDSAGSERKAETEAAPPPEPATKITPAIDIVPATNIMPADKHPKENNIAAEICQLKIFLFIVKPQVWRRLLVPSDITLARLSDLIEILFDWDGYDSHQFVPTDASGNGVTLQCDEATFRFCDLGFSAGDKMLYEYGGLDSWTHDIVFEKIVPFDKDARYPICTAGRMTSPPESTGGPIGFMEAKSYMSGRKIKETKKGRIYAFDQDFCEEISKRGGFDAFDIEAVNQRLIGAVEPSVKPFESTPGKPVLKLVPSITTTKPAIEAQPAKPEIYQYKITIVDVSPQIWRRVQIKSDSTLADLSDVIVAAFDWSGDHLHKFIWSSSWSDELAESKQLCALGLRPGDLIMYEYDFGDLWEHKITFEKTVRVDKNRNYPTCTAGQNAGPPEDCGGPDAYMNARNFLSRRKGKKARAPRGRVSVFEKEFYRENYRSFDPDEFDRDEVNQQLAELFKGK